METQNITLSLPKRTLNKIKQIAAQRQTSVSALLSEILEEFADKETSYNRARQRQLAFLEKSFDLDMNDKRLASREELHKR